MAEPGTGGPLSIYVVVGEESGDALGADLVAALRRMRPSTRFLGLAGPRMRGLGLTSLFDISDISVMGLAGVVGRLPTLAQRIGQVAGDIVARRPDVVVLIDSPDFSFRVARRVKRRLPGIPIVKYVCPSVWAWRPGRARAMVGTIDHILALLPFEPKVLAELGGPPATYVGHPLAARFADMNARPVSAEKVLLVLPGSRRSEVRLLLPDIAATLDILARRGNALTVILPAVAHLEDEIRRTVAAWPRPPQIVSGEAAKLEAFARADAALAASGTVLLELALHRVPTISIYRLDWLMYLFRGLITGWSAALPNLITDEALVPERVDDMIRPGWLARAIEALLRDGLERRTQVEGFERMAQILAPTEAPGTIAARKVLELAGRAPTA
ncbi:MAG: lipid-A-disaccharide synthase [Alphaproteobacteria bacterium]|nr:MAG: lipid-A-disaccharide synthase [Alphaproteobacteria bacterium]